MHLGFFLVTYLSSGVRVIFLKINWWTSCWLFAWLEIHGRHAMTVHIKQDLITILACFWCESSPDNSKKQNNANTNLSDKNKNSGYWYILCIKTEVVKTNGITVKNIMQTSYLLIYFASSSVATPCTSVLWSNNPI